MVGLLVLLFIVVPIVELFLFVQVSDLIGFLPALGLVVAFSVAGAWLVKHEGLGVLRRSQAKLDRGEVPAVELVNGLLILFAGLLMLCPGFLTDLVGLVLLLPPTRALVRLLLLRRFERSIRAAFAAPAGFAGAPAGDPLGSPLGSPFGGAGFRSTRVFTGTATYGGVVDVHEVVTDPDGGSGGRSGHDGGGDPGADPGADDDGSGRPALGRS